MHVFLKPSHVVDYPDFDRLLKPESTPHLQYKLTEEHWELHGRYQSKGKASGKGKVVDMFTLSSEDGSYNNKNCLVCNTNSANKQTHHPSSNCHPPLWMVLRRPTRSLSSLLMIAPPDPHRLPGRGGPLIRTLDWPPNITTILAFMSMRAHLSLT